MPNFAKVTISPKTIDAGLASALDWSGKTLSGAKRWASRMLGPATPLRDLAA